MAVERSLKRLKPITWATAFSFPQELDTIFSSKGAIQALETMQQKLVRFAGIWSS